VAASAPDPFGLGRAVGPGGEGGERFSDVLVRLAAEFDVRIGMSLQIVSLSAALIPLLACAVPGEPGASDGPPDSIKAPPSARATQIAVGRLHTCALTDKGRVRCWGQNDFGQVGTGDPRYYETPESDRPHKLINTPMEIAGLEGVTAISSSSQSEFNCALTGVGEVYCWGIDLLGQLGTGIPYTDSRKRESPVPVKVAGISGAKAIAVGGTHACALTATGGVKCWGSNDDGQLGDGSPVGDGSGLNPPYKGKPVDVPGISGATAIASGNHHTCVITSAGGLSCWGSNLFGESAGDGLVDSHLIQRPTPVNVTGLASGVARVSIGHRNTCVTMTSGELRCFGRELGLGSARQLSDPHPSGVTTISELAPADAVSTQLHTAHVSCAVIGGGARCWGDNYYSALGHNDSDVADYGFTTWVPVDVVELRTGVSDVQVGGAHVCALLTNGAVKCWGDRVTGNGDESGTRLSSQSPQAVVSLP
jgi:alpha-tubulin suppressor-like RCC1 family protein